MNIFARSFAALLLLASPALAAEQADLQLVLAVDASGSVDDDEYALQLQGIAAALADEKVREAIRTGPLGRIAINVVIWAEPQVPKHQTGWRMLSGGAETESFAREVGGLPRLQNGATGIGEGIASSLRSMETSGIEAARRVIDVSGDGEETPPRDYVVLLPQARAAAIAMNVTINGLAITNEDAGLLAYYSTFVRTGADSFAMAAPDYQSFAEAMRRKLLREIEWRPKLSAR